MKKKLSILLSVILVLMMVTACGGGGGGTGTEGGDDSGETVKIGCIYPLSGSNALLGDESLRGAQIAIDEINGNGGIWGQQIELVIADAPDVTAGQTEAERLITKDGVKLIFGAYSSGLGNVISDVCARYEVPYFELGAVGRDIVQKGYPYLWRTCAEAQGFGEGQAEFFDNTVRPILGVEKADARIAMVHEDSLYGTSIAEAATEALVSMGYKAENIKDFPYGATSVDLSSVILSAKNFDPHGMFSVSYVNDAILLARQCEELNFVPPFWIGAGGGTSMRPTLEAVGNGMYGLYGIDFPQYAVNTDNIKGINEYLEMYTAAYNEQPRSGHSMTNYSGIMIMADVLRDAGSLDKDAIKDAASAIDKPENTYTGGWGAKFAENGQNLRAPLVVGMWNLEELVGIWPEEFAIADPVVPMPTWEEKKAM